MISCAHIRPEHFHRPDHGHRPDPAGRAKPREETRGKACVTAGAQARRDPAAGLLLIGTALLLAMGGCGREGYEDSYPATSGVIIDGGAGTTAETAAGAAGDQAVDQIPGQIPGQTSSPDAAPSGTILFMASPGDGQPPRLIARTSSVTSVPTAEFLAREALASQPRAAAASTPMTAPLVITGDDDLATPIILPAAPSAGAGSASSRAATPQTNSRITISRQTGVDDGPTVLRIIEAP